MDAGTNHRILSLALVLPGVMLLSLSLLPTWRICAHDAERRRGWRFLFFFVLFFVGGYVLYGVFLLSGPVDRNDLLVSSILLGGGVFVFLVARMSVGSIRHVREIADRERHRALHDLLTGLPNRTLLMERLEQAIRLGRRRPEPVAVLLMDLDRFKEINDTLGHHVGDLLLARVAPRLQAAVRESDTIARLGGDEFAVVFPGAGVDQAVAVARKIARAMEAPFEIEEHSLHVGISIGVALFPGHGEDASELLKRADVAMYAAKRSGRDFVVYEAEQDEYTVQRLKLITGLREAIMGDELSLHFQPKFAVRDRRIRGVEALLRWNRNGSGPVPPSTFIPVAEQCGLIKPLTQWVLDNALRQSAAWRSRGIDLLVSVNLSGRSLQDPEFPADLRRLLGKWDVRPGALMLEIKEDGFHADPRRSLAVLRELAEMGLLLSVDDFGTGYSSLASLRDLPMQEIKIDRSFISNIEADSRSSVIVRSTIDLAYHLGREVIAEGVESQEAMEILHLLGCDMAQGNLLCEPLPAESFTDWLNASSLPVESP